MTPKTLERLLIDRTLGELPTETTELLDAFLQLQPNREALEAQVGETLRLAGLALEAEEPVVEIALPNLSPRVRKGASLGSSSVASPRSSQVGRWQRHLAIAAGLLLAFFLGSLGELRTSPEGTHHLPTLARGIGEPNRTTIHSSDFWSLSRLQADRASRTTTRTQRIKWIGPLTPSIIGDES